MSNDERRPYAEAMVIAKELVERLKPYTEHIEIAGSLRRFKETVGDIEIVAIPRSGLLNYMDGLIGMGFATKAVYSNGTTRWGNTYRGMMYKGMKCEVFLADEWNWGSTLWLRTGPGDANAYIMRFCNWKSSPYTASGGYWWHGDKRLAIQSEEDFFHMLGMKYLMPSERTEDSYRAQLERFGHNFGAPPTMCVVYFDRDSEDPEVIDCSPNATTPEGKALAPAGEWVNIIRNEDYLKLLRTRWAKDADPFIRILSKERVVIRIDKRCEELVLSVLRRIGASKVIAVVFGGVVQPVPKQLGLFGEEPPPRRYE